MGTIISLQDMYQTHRLTGRNSHGLNPIINKFAQYKVRDKINKHKKLTGKRVSITESLKGKHWSLGKSKRRGQF